MKDVAAKDKKTQDKEPKELTQQQRRTAEDAIRSGLAEMQTSDEIHKRVNDALGIVTSRTVFKRLLDVIRQDFQVSSGFFRESMQHLADKRIRKILANDESDDDLAMKAIKEADRLFDLKRKPEEDLVAICKVVDQEMERIRGLSDEELLNYRELLKNPKLDEEFHNMVEAQKRGQLYAIESGELMDKKSHTYNVTHKPRVRKAQKRKPKPPQDGQST